MNYEPIMQNKPNFGNNPLRNTHDAERKTKKRTQLPNTLSVISTKGLLYGPKRRNLYGSIRLDRIPKTMKNQPRTKDSVLQNEPNFVYPVTSIWYRASCIEKCKTNPINAKRKRYKTNPILIWAITNHQPARNTDHDEK